MVKYCPKCEVDREFRAEDRTETYRVRGCSVSVLLAAEVCESCGEVLFDENRDQDLADIFLGILLGREKTS